MIDAHIHITAINRIAGRAANPIPIDLSDTITESLKNRKLR